MASIYKRKGDTKYTISYYLRPGVRKQVRGSKDRQATEALARKLESDALLRREGVIDARTDRYSAAEGRPLIVKDAEDTVVDGHLADFHASLLAKGVTAKQAGEVRARVVRLTELAKIDRISRIVPSTVQQGVGSLRDDAELSLRTCNHYLKAIKQFSRWLWKDGRCREDAIAHLSGYNVKTDRRHVRRALTAEELARVIEAAEQGDVVMGMSGPDRAMLIRLATGTGFRVNELRSLTRRSFDLDATPATVTVEAGYSKRRRRDEQPIREDLAMLLQTYLAGREANEPIFHIPAKPGLMLREDLKAAGVPYKDGADRVVDFHALRHTFITHVVKSGASVKVCQELARHSDPKLTMNVYTHLTLHDRAKALDGLPGVTPEGPKAETAMATGTYDAPEASESVTAHMTARREPEVPSLALAGHQEKLDPDSPQGVQSPVAVSTYQQLSEDDSEEAPVAQLDRASVFGTEG